MFLKFLILVYFDMFSKQFCFNPFSPGGVRSVGGPQHVASAPAPPSLLGPPGRRRRAGGRRLRLLPRLRTPLLLGLLGRLRGRRGGGQRHEPRPGERTLPSGETAARNLYDQIICERHGTRRQAASQRQTGSGNKHNYGRLPGSRSLKVVSYRQRARGEEAEPITGRTLDLIPRTRRRRR